MKKRSYIIIALVVIGVILFTTTEFIIKPRRQAKQEKYNVEQQDSVTHDFKRALEYKTPYMGDNSKVMNINYNLPLNNIEKNFELKSETLEIIINCKEDSTNIEENKLKRDLIYNVTANFVLIDNLNEITFEFNDKSYTAKREDLNKWYNRDLKTLQSEELWKENVQNNLSNKEYVDKFWSENIFNK